MWTKNFQTYRMNLEKADEPKIKLSTFTGSRESKRIPEKHLLHCLKLLTVWITTNWKILRDGNTRPPYLSPEKPVCRSRTAVRTGHGTMDWFKIGKGVQQGSMLSPCLFNLYAEYIMQNARLNESHAGIKITRRNINSLRYAYHITLMAENEEELKSLLME